MAIFVPNVMSYNDYYPFGMLMPTRHESSDGYRYGFNGMEKDDEIEGQGNSYTTQFRAYDPRLGRWLSLDPLMAKYPHQSGYAGFNNNPIYYADPTGLEGEDPYGKEISSERKESVTSVATYDPKTRKTEYLLIHREESIVKYVSVANAPSSSSNLPNVRVITTVKSYKVTIAKIQIAADDDMEINNGNERVSYEYTETESKAYVHFNSTFLERRAGIAKEDYALSYKTAKISTLRGKDVEITNRLKQTMKYFGEFSDDTHGHYDVHALAPTLEAQKKSIDEYFKSYLIGKVPYAGNAINIIQDMTVKKGIQITDNVLVHRMYKKRPMSQYIHTFRPDIDEGFLSSKENKAATQSINKAHREKIGGHQLLK